MKEAEAKQQLTEMLEHFTVGSVLHLLSDLHRQEADEAKRFDDVKTYRQAKLVEHTQFVVGLGLDAANPR